MAGQHPSRGGGRGLYLSTFPGARCCETQHDPHRPNKSEKIPQHNYFSPGISFSGQRHSMSATDIYPQPSGWGAVSVRRTLLQGRTDLHTGQVDTWKVKLAKCGGVVRNPQAQVLLQTNLSPPSTSQSCRGSQVLGERNPAVSPQNISSQPPL